MSDISRYIWIAFMFFVLLAAQNALGHARRRHRDQPELLKGYFRMFLGQIFWMNLPWLAMGVGILAGRTESVFDYLQPGRGNIFVLMWWGLVGILFCIGTLWIFLGRGAETLARYPGYFMIPILPAKRLRIYWICLVVWNLACFVLLVLFSPEWLIRDKQPNPPPGWLIPFWVFAFPLMLSAISFEFAAVGGWYALAENYRADAEFSGKKMLLQSANFGWISYKGCMMAGADPNGVYLSVIIPFRIGHPPLFIPWSKISGELIKKRFNTLVEFRIVNDPAVFMTVSKKLAEALVTASGNPDIIPSMLRGAK